MWVTSPQTRSSGPGCGVWPGGRQQVSLPSNGVVYVQNVPASQSVSGCSGTNNGLGYPYDPPGAGTNNRAVEDQISYECRNGDAFVEGTVDGRVTVAAENNLAIIWHVRRADSSADSDDIIGLVAQNLVQVYHPVRNNSNNPGSGCPSSTSCSNLNAGPNHSSQLFRDPVIEAAVLSVTGSFLVPNWDNQRNAPLGTINLYGALAQIYRGPVGTFSGSTQVSGYDKNYVYDNRFTYQSPPSYIDPVEGQWGVVVYTECPSGTCS